VVKCWTLRAKDPVLNPVDGRNRLYNEKCNPWKSQTGDISLRRCVLRPLRQQKFYNFAEVLELTFIGKLPFLLYTATGAKIKSTMAIGNQQLEVCLTRLVIGNR
jgi:hypothetical protein